jgi:hypothetical protein
MRQRLAAEQAAVVQALTGRQPPPAGFDVAHLATAAAALAQKRCRSVAMSWPALTQALGERFEPAFAAFAAAIPLPEIGGPLADGRAFARHVGVLPDKARLEVLAVDLRFRSTKRGLRLRRGPALRFAWLQQSRRLVLGAYGRWLGMHWLSLRLSFGG